MNNLVSLILLDSVGQNVGPSNSSFKYKTVQTLPCIFSQQARDIYFTLNAKALYFGKYRFPELLEIVTQQHRRNKVKIWFGENTEYCLLKKCRNDVINTILGFLNFSNFSFHIITFTGRFTICKYYIYLKIFTGCLFCVGSALGSGEAKSLGLYSLAEVVDKEPEKKEPGHCKL